MLTDSTRRAALFSILAATCSVLDRRLLPPAIAAQRGEELNPPVMFDARPCVRRTALGACAEQGTGTALAPAAPAGPANGGLRIIDATASRSAGGDADESDYIRMLRKRSEENAEQNAAFVREKTLANGMGGAFGPFSKSAAVMRADGSIMILPVGKYERLKDRGFIVVAPSGAGCLKKLRNGEHTHNSAPAGILVGGQECGERP